MADELCLPHTVAQTLQPKLEVLEAAWARLHTITGAEAPEDVIAYWEGGGPQAGLPTLSPVFQCSASQDTYPAAPFFF